MRRLERIEIMAKLKIDVTDFAKSYGNNEVLKALQTRFNEGDVVCIIGPSVLVNQPSKNLKRVRRNHIWDSHCRWL